MENTGKITNDKSVNEGKEMAESKVDNVKEVWSSITSIKNKNEKVDTSISSIKNKDDTVEKVEESETTSVSNRLNEITRL